MSHIRNVLSHPRANSVWVNTYSHTGMFPALETNTKADVIIVGAGFTGLSAALHLASMGANVCVLEAHQPGWGASGRNGGQVNPTLKHDPTDLRRMFGARADALIDAVSSSADLVFELIRKHHIDCDPKRSGWIQASYTEAGTAHLHKRAEQWRGYGIPVKSLDKVQVSKLTGSDQFKGGWIDSRAGSLHPFAYVMGLANAAIKAGAYIYGGTSVSSLNRLGNSWQAVTDKGLTVQANQVIIATNGYTDNLVPGLARTILSANSFMVSTTPLGLHANNILANGETLSTAQRLLLYLRKDQHNRLLLGGRGSFSDPHGISDFAHLERSLNLLYPHLAPFKFEYHWAGRIAITRDFMPHVHQPESGLTVALGYNGRGIATGTAMGKHLAALLAGGSVNEFPFPITPIRRIPFHSLQRLYITIGVAWYSLLDKMGVHSG